MFNAHIRDVHVDLFKEFISTAFTSKLKIIFEITPSKVYSRKTSKMNAIFAEFKRVKECQKLYIDI